VRAIERVDGEGRLATQASLVRAVAQARRASPEASLAELAAETGLSRPAVQRALEHLVALGEAAGGA
jgi:DNA-binding IclR family transcriptional regulator